MTTSTTSQLLARIRRHLWELLKAHGFRQRGDRFCRDQDQVVQLVEIQRSREGTAQRLRIAVNLGVASIHLLEIRGRRNDGRQRVESCHWRRRLTPTVNGDDHWWTAIDLVSAEQVGDAICESLLSNGLAQLQGVASETLLCEAWERGSGPGLTEAERLVFLSELRQILGPPEAASQAMKKVRSEAAKRPSAILLERIAEADRRES